MSLFEVRELFKFTREYLFDELPSRFNIKFEDGIVLESTKKELIISNFFWDMHREYKDLPLLSRHHVSEVLKGKPLSSNTHMRMLTILSNDIRDVYKIDHPEGIEKIAEMVYKITNNIYNEITLLAEKFITSIDILDFIEIINDPEVVAAVDRTKPNSMSIAKCYEDVKRIFKTSRVLANNPVVKSVNSQLVNVNQILQCVTIRGFLTEVNGDLLLTAVMTNYTKGLLTVFDNTAESLAAAKSMNSSGTKIQDTEYFARRLQLLAMVAEFIDYEDCGSTEYINWLVNPPNKDEAKGIDYPGDLKFIVGKNYYDEETKSLKQVSENDKHLYGKTIKIRSPMYCKSQDQHKVCKVCFGGLYINISRFSNIGHLCSATMTKQSTSFVLSTKHLTESSIGVPITLDTEASKLFNVNRNNSTFLLKPFLKDASLKLILNKDNALGLTDILITANLDNVNIIRISSVKDIDFKFIDKSIEYDIPVNVDQSNRSPVLTLEFLSYLKKYRWEIDSRNNFVFDMKDWDFNLPILKLPEAEYSYADHSNQVAKMIESSVKKISDRANPESPISTLQELFMLVNSKLNVNLAVLEVIMYVNMVPDRNEFGLSRKSEVKMLGVADQLIKSRSLSNAYAYECQTEVMLNPRSFFKENRPDSILDVCIEPEGVIKERKRKSLTKV